MKYFSIVLIALAFVFTALVFQSLPSQMPMHWNLVGEVDSYMTKNFAAWLMPCLAIFLYLSFHFAPKFDPKKEKYTLFSHEWDIIKTGIIAFLLYVHGIIIYASLNGDTNIMSPLFVGLGSLFILIGNYLSKVRQNYFIGIRTPWSLESEENWNKTHRYASWTFVFAGLIVLIEAFVLWYAPIIIFGSIMFAALLPVLYSYLFYTKRTHLMKYLYIGVILLGIVVSMIRFSTPEDSWICDNSKWVKHGQPTSAMPKTICK